MLHVEHATDAVLVRYARPRDDAPRPGFLEAPPPCLSFSCHPRPRSSRRPPRRVYRHQGLRVSASVRAAARRLSGAGGPHHRRDHRADPARPVAALARPCLHRRAPDPARPLASGPPGAGRANRHPATAVGRWRAPHRRDHWRRHPVDRRALVRRSLRGADARGAMGATGAGARGGGAGTGAAMASIVSTAGTLLVNTFLPPPMPEISKNSGNDSQAYLITGGRNRVDIWGKVPFVCGRFRVVAALRRPALSRGRRQRDLLADHLRPRARADPLRGAAHRRDAARQLHRGGMGTPARLLVDAGQGRLEQRHLSDQLLRSAIPGRSPPLAPSAGRATRPARRSPSTAWRRASDANSWDRDQGKPFTLYPDDVFEDGLAIALTYVAGAADPLDANERRRDRHRGLLRAR